MHAIEKKGPVKSSSGSCAVKPSTGATSRHLLTV